MFLLQPRKLLAQLAFFLFRHCRLGRARVRREPGKWLWSIAFWLTADKSAGLQKHGRTMHSGYFPSR